MVTDMVTRGLVEVGHQTEPEAGKFPDLVLIAALCLTLYLTGNGRVSLWDRDEAWYAQTAREMVQSNDYIVPTFNAEPRLRKPVMIYWLMSCAYGLLGDNEFAARFCSAIAGTITCCLTYRLGVRMFGRAVGLAAGCMLAVAPLMAVESKLATTDAVLTATLTGAISCLWELYCQGFSWHRSLMFWWLMGVAILTKGPFALAFMATGILAWLVLSRQWSVLRRFNWLPGIALACAVALPWGILIYLATDGEFYRVALGDQALGHVLSSKNDHRGFPGYHLVIAFAGLLPWSLLFPSALSGVRHWARQAGPCGFLLGWILGPLLMLELMRTKLPQYYLPAFPACAILIARGVREFHVGKRLLPSSRRLVWVIGASGVGLAIALLILTLRRGPAELSAPLLALSIALVSGSALVTYFVLFRQQNGHSCVAAVATSWSMGLIIAAWLLPSAEVFRVPRVAARALARQAGGDSCVALFGYREPSLVYYLGRPTPTFGSAKDFCRFVQAHGPTFTLLRDSDLERLRKEPRIVIESYDRVEARTIRGVRSASVLLARVRVDSGSGGTARRSSDEREGSRN